MTTMHLTDIHHLVVQVQRSHATVRRAMEKLGIKPAAVINGIEHFSSEDVDRVCEYLEAERKR